MTVDTDAEVPAAVLEAWGFSGAAVTTFERGLINRHWLAVRGEARLVLRRYNPARTLDAVAWEQALVRHAGARGWPVGVPVATASGATVFEHERRAWAAAPFLPGEPELEPGEDGWRLRGKLLAEFHRDVASFDIAGQRPTFGTTADLDARLAQSGAGTFDELVAALQREHPELGEIAHRRRERSRADLELLGYATLPQLPIHGDFQRFNLLWTGGELTGLLDFDFARRDAQLCDLTAMLMPFMPLPDESAAALLAGYESVRPLSDAEWDLLPAVTRAHLLSWVAHLLAGWREGNAPQTAAALTRTLTVRFPALDAAEAGWRTLHEIATPRRVAGRAGEEPAELD